MLGTKGSVSNLVQCTHSLGRPSAEPQARSRGCYQQIIQDNRLPLGDYGRVFPHDRKNDDSLQTWESQGLLWSESFIEGLSPIAFFIHAIAGREALVEGATSTALSGYAMRLGVKMMESDVVE